MKFDTVIIGGGLAGLVCGIKLGQQNKKCAIISAGQSALHFCSGSLDLLNNLPDGKEVVHPFDEVENLIAQNPKHPYSKLGKELFKSLSVEAIDFLTEQGIPLSGQQNQNHYRITPLGEMKATWQTITPFATSTQKDQLPWSKVALFNMSGFLDFYPKFIATALSKLGTKFTITDFSLASLDRLRRNPSELRSSNITNVMDQLGKEEFDQLVAILKKGSEGCDALLFPAILSLSNDKIIGELEKAVGKPLYLIPTLPPSVIGIKMQRHLQRQFLNLGGVYMLGDNITHGDIKSGRVEQIYSFNHGDIPFKADHFVLATGSYFSQGLIANRTQIYEPIFKLDINYSTNRSDWYQKNVFDKQAYMSYGIETNANFQGQKNNQTIDNLYVIGAGLESFNAIKEGCGSGVSLLTALQVAKNILRK